MTIKLKISNKTLTIGDVIAAEEGFKSNRAIIEFLARFVVDDDGAPVQPDEAQRRIMALPVADLPELVKQLQEAITGIQADAVPLATSDG
jgi:hypothetical protein